MGDKPTKPQQRCCSFVMYIMRLNFLVETGAFDEFCRDYNFLNSFKIYYTSKMFYYKLYLHHKSVENLNNELGISSKSSSI